MISKIKGTQDFINLDLFNFIIKNSKQLFEQYNFSEIATPILESLELFKRTVGEHTDVVSKEMFIISPPNNQDDNKKAKDTICLRPEATAATVRAFLENNIATDQNHTLPWKVFSFGPMFRYERPQKGRFRQFHQINLEVIGSSNISEDALLIFMLNSLFRESFKLENFSLSINFLGTKEDRDNYRKELILFLNNNKTNICPTCLTRKDSNPLRVFDCKNQDCQDVYNSAPVIIDYLSQESKDEWDNLQKKLSILGISFVCNNKLVRGLDYYNKTVFEFSSPELGAQSAFCGGGRYDKLATMLGSKQDFPSIGAAIGIERLLMLLENNINNLNIKPKPALTVIVPIEPEQNDLALLISQNLHNYNIYNNIILDNSSVKSMMRKANKLGAKYVLLIGPEELASNKIKVKNMQTSKEQDVSQADISKYILENK